MTPTLVMALVGWPLTAGAQPTDARQPGGQDGMTNQDAQALDPARLVLEGVPRVGFYPKQSTNGPEDHTFPACLRASLEYLWDDIYEQWLSGYGDWHAVYEYLVAASGTAFELVWAPRGWELSDTWSGTAFAPDPLEPMRRAFASVGYGHEIVLRSEFARTLGVEEGLCDDEGVFRRRIAESLGRGRPVIAFGVVGPAGPCLVTGYDEGGDVLSGWSFGQDDPEFTEGVEFEPSGYFRKRDWFANTHALVLIGEKGARPAQREAYRQALLWGLRLMRMTAVRGNASGQAAYAAWAEDLTRDADFAGLPPADLAERLRVSDGVGGHVAEARTWGGSVLRPARTRKPAPGSSFVYSPLDKCLGAWYVSCEIAKPSVRLPRDGPPVPCDAVRRMPRDVPPEAA